MENNKKDKNPKVENKEVFITDKGHKMPNKWKKGDKISVHPSIAKGLIEAGYATEKAEK